MTRQTIHTIAKSLRSIGLIALTLVVVSQPVPVLAQESGLKPHIVDYDDNNVDWWDPNAKDNCSSGGTVASGDDVGRYVQALALQENHGKVTGGSATGAKGKYQYMDSTWKANSAKYYPPAGTYPNANAAPEEVQDALVYIEYTDKFKQFNGDLFKISVSHFLPAAVTDPSRLDVIPPGNVITPRQYAQQVMDKFNSGAASKIPMKAADAPQFAEYLAKLGKAPPASAGGSCAGNGIAQGNIQKTALGLAWPDQGHGKNKEDATPLYQTTMPNTAQASGDDEWSDCGVFVATVMIASGVDKDYQKRGSASQLAYVRAHPEKYKITESAQIQNTSNLKPGDIMIQDGHTFIYTGEYDGKDGKKYDSASGSLHDHVPQADKWYPGFVAATVIK